MDYAQRNLGAVQQSAKTALEGVGPLPEAHREAYTGVAIRPVSATKPDAQVGAT